MGFFSSIFHPKPSKVCTKILDEIRIAREKQEEAIERLNVAINNRAERAKLNILNLQQAQKKIKKPRVSKHVQSNKE